MNAGKPVGGLRGRHERDLESRIAALTDTFTTLFARQPDVIARAPGRAEILGCHTDYNYGFALAAGISRSTLTLLQKRSDTTIHVYSSAYPDHGVVTFPVGDQTRDTDKTWTNYVRAVIRELVRAGHTVGGANILIDSTVPKSGGVSSSAALELAIAFGMLGLYKEPIDRTKTALLCKVAENSDLVNSPCGFLDQGASAFAQDDAMVLLDFLPKGESPVSDIQVIPAHFPTPVTFTIPVDPTLERQLGETGYVVRRKMCEESLPFWTTVLGRPVKSLRDVSINEFEVHRDELDKKNTVMRKRVEHIVRENQRVLDAVAALQKNDMTTFGRLLTEAGRSSLELYELDENTPQLTFLVETGRTIPGVVGMRNMGGGFSAIALALVADSAIQSFQKTLSSLYNKKFGRSLEFIDFSPSQGAEVIYHA